MHTFTKVFLAVTAVIAVIFGIWYGSSRYLYNHPDIEVTFYTSGEGDVNVFTVPQMTMEPRTKMGLSEQWDNRYFEIYDIIGEMIQIAKSHENDSEPWFFDSRVENVDGKTVFTVDGYYTENGEKVDVSKSWSVDYILTDKIAEH